MIRNIRRALQHRSWEKLTNLPPSRLMAIVLVLVVPGGLLLPIWYAVRAVAIRLPPQRVNEQRGTHGSPP